MKKRILFLYCALIFIPEVNAQWNQQVSGSSNYLDHIFFPTTLVGYVTNGSGGLIKTTNGGSNWNNVSGVSGVYGALWFTSIDTGYVAGTGGMLKTTNGGTTWIDNFVDNVSVIGGICFLTRDIGFCVGLNMSGDTAILFKTVNAGNSWNKIGKFYTFGNPENIVFTSLTTGFVVTNGDALFKTIDGGVNWVSVFSDLGLNNIFFPSPSIGYLVSYSDIYKSIDGGDTWNVQVNPNPSAFYSIYFTDNNNGYAAGGDGFSTGVIVKTTDGGINWTLSLTNSYTYRTLHFPSSSTGYACGSGGAIFRLSNATGIETSRMVSSLKLYPNPSNGIFTMEGLKAQKNSTVFVCDVLGNNIIQEKIGSRDENFKIDISSQAKGIYYVKLESDEGIQIEKIVYQ
jgi:photosystem II stability/assembly factor-like uncharacterized protein